MAPECLSAERTAARVAAARAARGVVAAHRIAAFCRRCLSAEDRRERAAEELQRRWRRLCLDSLSARLGLISSLTKTGLSAH